MIEKEIILRRLYEHIETSAKDLRIADLRIGLSYVGIKLDNGSAGLAAVLPENSPRGCTVLKEAGTYVGSSAIEVLKNLVDGKNALHRTIGVATANALVFPKGGDNEDREATTYLNLKPGEKVAMVGLFSPLVEKIKATGAILAVIEKNPERLDLLSPEEKQKALQDCDVAIITATTLLNNTFEETVNSLGKPRSVALLGPSTPLVPEIFRNTPVTHLGGVAVKDSAKVMQIISEGGGTPALRPYLRFVNLLLEK